MTSDLSSYYPVKLVGRRLPHSGKPLHPKVAIRWCTRGVHGVRLRYIAAGRQKLTTDEWLMEFCDAVAKAQQSAAATPNASSVPARAARLPDTSRQRTNEARRAKTARILQDIGLGSAG